ncbi:MAG: hypothetical protein CVV57_09525 [Tenericutes bacterium HGW-Tenericutes-2]|jgi:NhaP-type Na+/H+ or K+/H+ antiporter|nr:MAG: hypothetical protein CVV57_09525 [Tenericutes bacterium HGW-Tenericutes-2]
MKLMKRLIPAILFYIILGITFFLPQIISTVVLFVDFILFVVFLVVINQISNRELENNESKSFWSLVINLATFGVFQIVLLYGLMVWIVL